MPHSARSEMQCKSWRSRFNLGLDLVLCRTADSVIGLLVRGASRTGIDWREAWGFCEPGQASDKLDALADITQTNRGKTK